MLKRILTVVRSKKLNTLNQELNELKFLLNEITDIVSEIQADNLSIELSDAMMRSTLRNPIQSLLNYLQKVKSAEANRDWFNKGLSFFIEILKNVNGLAMDKLLDKALSELIKYVQANQGAVFILNTDDQKSDPYLEMVACYAYDRKKYISKKQYLGDGLAGQCVLERDTIYLKNIPHNYVNITSGLGEATPRNVLITPLIISDVVVGVIELASFAELDNNHKLFLKKISESLASVIKTGKEKKKLEEILAISQQQTEELRSQEEEMRQNLEEMESLQEQLARNEIELKRRLEEMEAALTKEKSSEITQIRENERKLLESKLETQKQMYELIINKLKSKLNEGVEI